MEALIISLIIVNVVIIAFKAMDARHPRRLRKV